MVTKFWFIVAGAAILKVVSYFISAPVNATKGYHLVRLLAGFIGYAGILSIVAFILSACVKGTKDVFKISFAILFSLACLLDLPVAIMRAQATTLAMTQAREAADARTEAKKATETAADLEKRYSAFEALMMYKENPMIGRKRTLNYATLQSEITEYEKPVYSDNEKYFNLSYCYATGYGGYERDIDKAVLLCQKAASEGNRQAQAILYESQLGW
jgi:hypothetical protein